MKNFKKFTAFVLALCMVFSLSVAAFAAEADEHTVYESAPEEEITVQSAETATSGTIPGSSIKWSLDSKGWLTISGSGEAPVFTSADDQPWAAVREQITEVWFEDVDTLTIPDLAYWFEGCVKPDHRRAAPCAGHWQARLLQLPEALYADHVLRRNRSRTASARMRSGAKPIPATRSISPTSLATRKQRCRSTPMIGRRPIAAAGIFMICTVCIRMPTVLHPLLPIPVL